MLKVNENDFDYRFGDSGPKYLVKGPNIDCGIVVIKPGQDFPNHHHSTCEEVFYVLEGEIDFYINDVRVPLQKGDLLQLRPHESHYLINNSTAPFKALFIKSPHLSKKDTVTVPNPIISKE
ncbi:cupin domain-containing protein [Priestia taiwanensis]|uniref:Polyketide synthase n=1 Tax=Priestia taiwanensis TaxID=1347902 RepID=A0A917EPF2_9BACI|nr:cupin domain-containing protein [Priestia taiwanensis]MBM7362448.1 mannose-6-phosphate isomerase-like protein (cupin superfamily) [Priestia taiwanensis]GGE62298.1 polyketide synthase [Priestia taiwanensis]